MWHPYLLNAFYCKTRLSAWIICCNGKPPLQERRFNPSLSRRPLFSVCTLTQWGYSTVNCAWDNVILSSITDKLHYTKPTVVSLCQSHLVLCDATLVGVWTKTIYYCRVFMMKDNSWMIFIVPHAGLLIWVWRHLRLYNCDGNFRFT